MELSPNNPLITTPMNAHSALWSPAHVGLLAGLPGNPSMIDPLRVLKAYDLPDPAKGFSEEIVLKMCDLIVGLKDGGTELCVSGSSLAVGLGRPAREDMDDELPPNLELLDPRNTAANNKSYTMANTAWILGDPMQNLVAAADAVPDAVQVPANDGVPQALVDLARRYGLLERPVTLLATLQQAFVDTGVRLRTRQFWATLEGGNVSDFVLLAHLAVAMREAQLSGGVTFHHPPKTIENTCYRAARAQWDRYRAEPTPSTVFALLLLSEYGYQTARAEDMWDFALEASAAARRIRVRGVLFPWHGVRYTAPDGTPMCDVELEYVLGCYWLTSLCVVLAAQQKTRRIDLSVIPGYAASGEQHCVLPEYPTHDMCCYTAQPAVPPGKVAPDTVMFPSDRPCMACPSHTYTAHLWQSVMAVIDIHNLYIDVLEQRCAPDAFLDAARQWDERVRRERETWPAAWSTQMGDMLAAARRINDEEHGGSLLLESVDFPCRPPVDDMADYNAFHSQRPAKAYMVTVGCHSFLYTPAMTDDVLLSATASAHEMFRLRIHCLVLALLQQCNPGESRQSLSLLFAGVPIGYSTGEQPLQETELTVASDPLRDSMELHRCQYVCLDVARNLQSVSTIADLLGVSLMRHGMLGISALELVVSVHCARINHSSSSTATRMDALRRLARILKHLLTLRHWAPVLYIFTAVVKAFVDTTCTVPGCSADIADSPLPHDHVLTLLMHEMQMTPREFYVVTVPLVYTALANSPAMTPSLRMRIASLLS
ncbi:hypothetical protein IWQ57_000885 [Coemansia nantahalensis]|uniref:Uncharacterized protein n=1 Tax=Coemansia nantahalensis TaxID=2789366 RepID=A0ACC1K614_9FUNG|nr:hypothetical protein IWQ57_000885 [Coemansia nantahalensis]